MRYVFATFVIGFVTHLGIAESMVLTGKPTKVTVYRDQAQVVREVTVAGKAGPVQVVVTDLPEHVLSASLFAECDGGIDVRAVRFRSRPVNEDPRPEVAELDARIRELSDSKAHAIGHQGVLAARKSYIDRMEKFVAAKASAEISNGTLETSKLEHMFRFTSNAREKVHELQHELGLEVRAIEEKLALLTQQREKLTQSKTRHVKQAVLFLEKLDDQPHVVRVNYMVRQCGWSPSYNLRANGKGNKITVEYDAIIHQMSGEDWSDVGLTLSTASPAMSSAGPSIAPLKVLVKPKPEVSGKAIAPASVAKKAESFFQGQQAFVTSLQENVSISDNNRVNWDLNAAANSYQFLEFNNDVQTLRNVKADLAVKPRGVSISYRLPGKVSLATRGDQQMVRITRSDVSGSLYYVAIPVLSELVYRQVQLLNSTPYDLLGGRVNVYLDEQFVGRTEFVTVARGQRFVVGFGADPQLICSRELVDRQEKTQWGNRVQQFKYRLAVSNFKKTGVKLRVYDRVPDARNNNQLKVTMGAMSDPLSNDKTYIRREKSRGILRWDLDLHGNTSGTKERVISFDYKLEFDRDSILTEPTGRAADRQREDFIQLQEDRMYAR